MVFGLRENGCTEIIICSRGCCVAQDRKVARGRHVHTDGAYVRLLLSSLVFLSTLKGLCKQTSHKFEDSRHSVRGYRNRKREAEGMRGQEREIAEGCWQTRQQV